MANRAQGQPIMSPAELTRRRKAGVLLICCMSLFIVGLDITVVNVALPSIASDLDADVSGLQWTVSAYTVVMASLLMFSGSMGDRLGRRRVFIVGLTVFSLASLLCSVAPSVEFLVAVRVLQAVGASMLNPVAMSIITNTFTDPRERAQAVGVWGAVFGVAMALGPIVGGALVSAAGWRSIFLINIPVGARGDRADAALRPRVAGAAGRAGSTRSARRSMVVLLAALTYAIIEGPSLGWSSPAILAAFARLGGGAGGPAPLRAPPAGPAHRPAVLPLDPVRVGDRPSRWLRSPRFGGFLFLNTLYLQEVRGLSPVQAGLATVPMAVMTVVASPLSGRLVGRRGPRLPLVIAGVCLLIACAMLTGDRPATPFGVAVRGLRHLRVRLRARQRADHQRRGVRDAARPGRRRLGDRHHLPPVRPGARRGGRRRDRHLAHRRVGRSRPVLGQPPAWWTLTACGGLVVVLGFLATTTRAHDSAQRTAEELNPEALSPRLAAG